MNYWLVKFAPFRQVKETPELVNIGLVKQPRLAVMPLNKAEFEAIVNLVK